jgi:hypothetical protein
MKRELFEIVNNHLLRREAQERKAMPTPVKIELTDHPLANIFPLMEGAEFETLMEDIKANGLREAITVYEEKILDGRNRYRAIVKAGLRDKLKEGGLRVYTGNDPIGFVLSANLHRRHLTTSQRSMVAANLCNLGVGANQHTGPGTSIEVSSKLLSVGRASVERALVVLRSGDQGLIDAVKAGEVSVGGAVSQLSESPPMQPEGDGGNTEGGTKKKTTTKKTRTTRKKKDQEEPASDPDLTSSAIHKYVQHRELMLEALLELAGVSSIPHALEKAEELEQRIDVVVGQIRELKKPEEQEEETEEKKEEEEVPAS